MILPFNIQFRDWWSNLWNDFPAAADAIPRMDDVSQWRDCVDRLCGIPTFSQNNVPRHNQFETPQEWACAFTKLMY